MPLLAIFTNFGDLYDSWKAVPAAFLGISKIPRVHFEIHSFSCYLLKMFVFGQHKFVPWAVGFRVKTETFFSYAQLDTKEAQHPLKLYGIKS